MLFGFIALLVYSGVSGAISVLTEPDFRPVHVKQVPYRVHIVRGCQGGGYPGYTACVRIMRERRNR